MTPRSGSRLGALIGAAALVAASLPGSAQAVHAVHVHAVHGHAAAVTHPRAASAATWQSREVTRHGTVPSAYVKGADWGLTVDTLFALVDGTGHPRIRVRMAHAIAAHITDYTTFGRSVSSGATAKVLLAAAVLGRSARHFGGMNVRRAVLGMVDRRPGWDRGHLRDRGTTDYSNTLGQSLGVIGLSRTVGGVPASMVQFLLKQRCPRGFFQIQFTPHKTCGQAHGQPDVDATSYALQALEAARRQGGVRVSRALIARSARWLLGAQLANGGFAGGSTTRIANANSTGLAALALVATAHGAGRAAARARQFVASLQITRANAAGGSARREIGAIAYDRAALRSALRNGIGGTNLKRDQWRRATAQGVFAFHSVPLGSLSVHK